MKKVLIAGATGYLGGHVLREFKKRGYWVRVLARNCARLENLNGISKDIDDVFIGQATDAGSLTDVCNNIDIVFSSIGITKQKDDLNYMDVDYQANLNLLREAEKAGVSKFIYISVFNSENLKDLKNIQAKLMFEDELRASKLDYSVIYPNGFFSDMMEYFNMARSGHGYVFGNGESKINPIHGADLAEVCVDAVGSSKKEISVGGPDVLTHNEILQIAFDTLKKSAKVTRIPIWTRNILLGILRTFTSTKTFGPLEFFMTVLAVDMVAPAYGKHHLKDFFFNELVALADRGQPLPN